MSQPPDHNHNLSMMLSEVLQDIGVTETMVTKTRKIWMIREAIENIRSLLMHQKCTFHYFGSQSEASTTEGLNSDIDHLLYHHDVHVIQDLSQWQPGKLQYLMVQDETVSPGYCLLQLLRQDVPLPIHDIPNEYHSKDSEGRVLLRHSWCLGPIEGAVIHGPAHSKSVTGRYEMDMVTGLYCPSWPKEAIPWLLKQSISGWPNELIKILSAVKGCLVVPVGSRKGFYQDLEWRISTSLAEKYLMYSLNMTQIRCYILMKMVLKTFLKPISGKAVSSFMCKNVLFYCIAGSEANSTWNEGSLLTRLNQCLQVLLSCIQADNCPHFVIPRNNLLAGKLSADMKRRLADVICTITGKLKQSLLDIQTDDLGLRFQHKSDGISRRNIRSADYNAFITANRLCYFVLEALLVQMKLLQHGDTNAQYLIDCVSKLDQLYREGIDSEKVAVSLLKPFLCTTIGSIKASADIQHSRNISPDAMKWFSLGLNSDIFSSRLKKASALYCAGDFHSCEKILADVSGKMSNTLIRSVCGCNPQHNKLSSDFGKLCYEKNEDTIKHNMAFCVQYMQCETNCIPDQLKYEMFRSTEEDRPYRHPFYDIWMEKAVVDSKPFLYFLQYKAYSHLHRPADQHRALDNLARTISTEPNLGHRETALNLLGQCLEQKNWLRVALSCYKRSLTVRERNNAAKWLVCMLLARIFRSK